MRRGSVVVGYLDDGKWSACFGLSYRDLCLYDLVNHGRIIREGGVELRKVAGTGGIVDGRNDVAERFLDDTDGEWLFMVDTDMGFADDTVERLIASADPVTRPVVGALAFALRRESRSGALHAENYGIIPTLYSYAEIDDEVGFMPMADYPRGELVQVAGTGAACLVIHRTVLHRMREKNGAVWFDPVTHPTGDKGKRRRFSEDLSFCIRVQDLGFKVFVDTAVPTCHEKGGVFLTEATYDRYRAGIST